MSVFDLLRAAVAPSIDARAGYLEGEDAGRQRLRQQRIQDEELALKKSQQQSADDEAEARAEYYRAFGRQKDSAADEEPVTYQIIDGKVVQVPTRRSRSTGASGGGSSDGSAAPFDGTVTQQDFDRALTGGSVVPTRDQGKSPLAIVREAVSDAQQPAQSTQSPSGVRAIRGVPVGNATPRTPPRRDRVVGNDGYYYNWDEATQRYVRSNVKAPAKAYEFSPNTGRGGSGSNAEARLRAQAALSAAEKDVPRPSKVPQPKALIPTVGPDGKIKLQPNPAYGDRMKDPQYAGTVRDSLAYERDVLAPLRQNLFSVTVPELNTKAAVPLARPDTTASAPQATRQTMSRASGTPVKLTGEQAAAMNAEIQRATENANAILTSPAPDALKQRARELLSRQLKTIARKYGATNP